MSNQLSLMRRFMLLLLRLVQILFVILLVFESLTSLDTATAEENQNVIIGAIAVLALIEALRYYLHRGYVKRGPNLKRPKPMPAATPEPEPEQRKLAPIPYIDFDDNELQPAQATLPDTMRRFVLAGDSKINQKAEDSA